MRKLAIVLVLLAACTKKQDQCMSNMDCTDPAYPFCDVNGQYAPADGDKNVCTIIPPDCPVDVCGCAPGATTCGSDSMLTVCNPDGMSVTQTACELACEPSGTACKTIVPSNGLGPALADAPSHAGVTLGSGFIVDTDSGSITDANNNVLAVASTLIAQTGVQPIRVFDAHTFTIDDIQVVGSNALAFVSDGSIEVDGLLNMVPDDGAGPGALPITTPCTGGSKFSAACESGTDETDNCDSASGGGGNYTAGGAAGGIMEPDNEGGSTVSGFSVLAGGCSGGQIPDFNHDPLPGGGGGGAIQLVSGTSVTLLGVLNVGGGGGGYSNATGQAGGGAGGGAGGMVVIEAPVVTIRDNAGITANGGGGGGCDSTGSPGRPDGTPASAGGCDAMQIMGPGGSGGTLTTLPSNAPIQVSGIITESTPSPGGGGGSVGRARIATIDGTLHSTSGSILSVAITNDTLVLQ